MKSRTYRAGTLREALAQVRRDLGEDALILDTREVRRRSWLGLRGRERVEVVAADGDSPRLDVSIAAEARSGSDPLGDRFDARLSRLHAMVADLSRQGRIEQWVPNLPAEWAAPYAFLLERDVPDPLARRLARSAVVGASSVGEGLSGGDFDFDRGWKDALTEAVEQCLAIAPPIAAVEGSRRIVALVGPTGVGKTTTAAKLAAEFKLSRGLRVGLVTVDTYRIAAAEQLRTYAEIIDLPFSVVNAAREIRRAIDDLGRLDLVLIDTAGRSPRDEVKIRELAEFLDEARPDETHLVLSAAASERALGAAVERFSAVRADRLILTKLDEADSLGDVFGVLCRAERPVSYLTAGQAVPDDIEPADRRRLARRILGEKEADE